MGDPFLYGITYASDLLLDGFLNYHAFIKWKEQSRIIFRVQS